MEAHCLELMLSPKKAVYTLCVAFGMLLSSAADAALFETTASYTITENPGYNIQTGADTQTATSTTSATASTGAYYGGDPDGSYATFASASADATGRIATLARGIEIFFDTTGHAHVTQTITNTSGTGGNFTQDIYLPYGSLNIYGNGFDVGDLMRASNEIDIRVDGVSRWSTRAELTVSSSGINFTQTGVALGYAVDYFEAVVLNSGIGSGGQYVGGAGYGFNDITASVDLGFLAAGQSAVIEYDMLSNAFANAPGTCGFECISLWANIADPNDVNSVPVLGSLSFTPTTTPPSNGVPEPASFALLVAGLAGLWTSRRKHYRRSKAL
jgi:hypothetical protein